MVITDPMFSEHAGPGPVGWVGRPEEVPAAGLLDAVAVSHNHYDHLDSGSVRDLHRRYGDGLRWYVPMGMKSWFTGNFGISEGSVREMVLVGGRYAAWDGRQVSLPGWQVVVFFGGGGGRRRRRI